MHATFRRRAVTAIAALAATMTMTASAAHADPVYPTMNDGGGVYWRAAPDWGTAVAQPGNGHYPGTNVSVQCYAPGGTVPGSANTMWVKATWVSGPGHGSGWINEHMLNDGAPIDQPAPGVPPCGGGGGGQASPSGGGGGGASCVWAACNGRDPGAAGCGAGARTLERFADGPFLVELRYSPRCHAAWTRIGGGVAEHSCNGWTPSDFGVLDGSGDRRSVAVSAEVCAVGGTSYTTMLSFHYWVRACYALRPEGIGDVPLQTERCTGWH